MLRFDDLVSQICTRASKQLAVLKRIGLFLNKQGKMTINNSFIVSNFNYCPQAWHFCSTTSANKLEKNQERALGFINNDFTSSLQALLTSTTTATLHVRRMKQMASEANKIVNNIASDYIKDLINIKQSNYNFMRKNQASLFSCEEHKVWSKVIPLRCRPNLELSP